MKDYETYEISKEYNDLLALTFNGKMNDFTDDEWYDITLCDRVQKAVQNIGRLSVEDYQKAIRIINSYKK